MTRVKIFDELMGRTFTDVRVDDRDGYWKHDEMHFVAEDGKKFYFPYQYDGATGVVSVYKNIEVYLSEKTPYPGG